MSRPLQILVLVLVLVLEGRAQTFSPGDYQINRRRDSPASGFEVAELLAGSNITITWDNTAKTATLSGSAGTGGTSITTLGTITTGTWNATPIADTYIASAATWNAKQAALVSGTNLKTVNGTSLLGSGNLAVDQTITLTGDVTGTGTGSFATTIANQAVTFAKMQHISTAHLLGRHSSGSGDVQQIGIDGGLELQGSNLRRAALTGDVNATAGSNTTIIAGLAVTTTKVADNAITYTKMQNVSAASRLLGRGQGSGSGAVQEIQLVGLSMSGTTLTGGDMLKSTYDQLNTGFISGKTGLNDTDGLGGIGGTLKLSGGDATSGAFTGEDGGPGGSIDLRGGNSPGSSVVGGAGGSLVSTGSNAGGYNGGTLNMSGGASGHGGSITTSDGGGAIDTTGQGSIGLGVSGTRTNLAGTATADRSISFQDSDGTVAFLSDITGTNSGTNTGDVTLAGTPDYITISGQTITRNAIDLAADVTGTLPVANGGTGATTLTANAVLLGNGTSAFQTVAPGTSGNVLTSNGTTWTSAAPSTGANPAGSGSELQYRSTATTFGALTSSSVSGANLTLGGLLTVTPAAANTGYLSGTGYSLTGSDTTAMLNLAGTWNTSGTPTALNINITDTASNAASNLAAFQIGGTTRVAFPKRGAITFPDSSTASISAPGIGNWAGTLGLFGQAGTLAATISNSVFNFGSGFNLSWGGVTGPYLVNDGNYTLSQRNGSNPQTFRIYETDSGANDEYLEISAASGTNLIRPQATGTGTASVVRYHTTTAVFWTSGSGSPESVVTAPVGSLYTRTDGGASSTLYVKESGSGSTGWIAK